MSQEQILLFLENHKSIKFTAKEIHKAINNNKTDISRCTIDCNLRHLRRTDFLQHDKTFMKKQDIHYWIN